MFIFPGYFWSFTNYSTIIVLCTVISTNSQTKLPAWHKATTENLVDDKNKVEQNLKTLIIYNNEIHSESEITEYITKVSKILHNGHTIAFQSD